MNTIKTCYTIMFCLLLSSCEFNCSVGGDKNVKTKTVSSSNAGPLNGAVIKNDIELEATGIKLKQAYLTDENDNAITASAVALGEKIYLIIETDTGWIKENNKSFVGASERVSTDAGSVIVDAPDIFKEYETTGLPADKAFVLRLSAKLSQAAEGVDTYVVQFRVWDKKGTGEIKGKYKFKIKS